MITAAIAMPALSVATGHTKNVLKILFNLWYVVLFQKNFQGLVAT